MKRAQTNGNTQKHTFQTALGKIGEAAVSEAGVGLTDQLDGETVDEILGIIRAAEGVIGGLNPDHEYMPGIKYVRGLLEQSYRG